MPDNFLMEQVKEGQVEKLAVLFERHHVKLYAFFLRLTGNKFNSEDLVQEVFIRILKYRTSYQGGNSFTAWLYRIARNAHIDHLKQKKDTRSLDEQWDQSPSRELSPPAKMEQVQDVALLNRALEKLPMKKREVLILCRFSNLQYKEIAKLIGCQVGTVKVMVHRAVKELGETYYRLSGGTAS